MNSFTSPKASPRHPLTISIPRVKNATPSRSITLAFRPWRSSTFSWKQLIRPSRKSQSFPDGEVLIADGLSSSSSLTLVGSPTEEKCTSPKMVRFENSPTYFYAKKRVKTPQTPTKKVALRSCLIVNKTDSLADDVSVYEDCLSTYPDFFQDYEDLLERERLRQVELEKSRPPLWQLSKLGCTEDDRRDYLSYCWSRYSEKKMREQIEGRRKVVYDHPMTLRWPSRVITERPVEPPPFIQETPPRRVVPEPVPVIMTRHQRIACEITDMLIILCIGVTIHVCIYIFGIYCFFNGSYWDDED